MRPAVIFWYGGAFMLVSKSDCRVVGTTLASQHADTGAFIESLALTGGP
jgi:hypothetical protein